MDLQDRRKWISSSPPPKVTCNVGDLEKLARARELHAGVVLITAGSLSRADQATTIRRAAAMIQAELNQGRDMANRAIRLAPTGAPTIENLPP